MLSSLLLDFHNPMPIVDAVLNCIEDLGLDLTISDVEREGVDAQILDRSVGPACYQYLDDVTRHIKGV